MNRSDRQQPGVKLTLVAVTLAQVKQEAASNDTATDGAMRTTMLMMGILFGAAAFPLQVRPRRQNAERELERAVSLTLRWLRVKLFAPTPGFIYSAHPSRVVPSLRTALEMATGGEQRQGKERR
jgi:hypothetical protein